MVKRLGLFWALLLITLPSWAQAPDASVLMQESGATLTVSAALQPIVVQPSRLLPYQKAFRSEDQQLELRVALRPLQRLTIEYQDPHSSAPEPNHIFPLVFDSLVGQLAVAGRMPTREFSTQQARELFNADWAAAAVFDIEPEFSSDYRQALLLALHSNNRADAYLIFLFDDYEPVKTRLRENLAALRFDDGA